MDKRYYFFPRIFDYICMKTCDYLFFHDILSNICLTVTYNYVYNDQKADRPFIYVSMIITL